MKMKASTGRKLKYGSTSIALTALVIAVVVVVNTIFSLCVQRFNWYVDLTPEPHFTLSEEFFELIGGTGKEGSDTPIEMLDKFRNENKAYNTAHNLTATSPDYRDEKVKVNILFCLDPDSLLADDAAEYVYRNALDLREQYPDYISVECVNSRYKPSRFTKYLSSNTEIIESDSVIIECGSEYRIRGLRSFYLFDGESTPVAYNAEKVFAAAILAVTRAEIPLACYTTNHGESFPSSSTDVNGNLTAPFLSTLEDAGYRTQAIDLSTQEIPEECRIVVVYNPRQDFLSKKNGTGAVSEIQKLEDFLAERKTLMVFMDPSSYDGEQGLANLEEFLEEWGLAFNRLGGDPYTVRDESNSLLGDSSAVIADYVEGGLALGWTASMTEGNSKPKVVFPSATALKHADGYYRETRQDKDDDGKVTGTYTVGYNGSYNRTVYDVFVSSTSATAWAGDREVAQATKTDPLKLLSVSTQLYSDSQATDALASYSYVLLCGSVDFSSEALLNSNAFGNGDFMLSACQLSGQEPIPVGLTYKQFANYTIETITSADATKYMVFLTVIPVLAALFVGVFVIVRRKNR